MAGHKDSASWMRGTVLSQAPPSTLHHTLVQWEAAFELRQRKALGGIGSRYRPKLRQHEREEQPPRGVPVHSAPPPTITPGPRCSGHLYTKPQRKAQRAVTWSHCSDN